MCLLPIFVTKDKNTCNYAGVNDIWVISHLDLTSVVNKGFVIWLSGNFFTGHLK